MLKFSKISPMVRAIGTMGAVAALVGGVTFALTSSPVTLADDTINASASLQISNGGAYSSSVSGFNFSGMVPGGAASPNQTFYLNNNGTNPVSVTVDIPTLPTFTVLPSGTVDDSQVFLNVSCTSGSSGNFSLTTGNDFNALSSGVALTGGPLQPGDTATCTANVSMGGSAVSPTTANSVSSGSFNLDFTGTD
ncbi:MAG TPA: hypothetical protein VGS28_03595 [Candidatus Saccharimonadales bacterium]|nr:hypothetical protein [Candidatus Saccharimonadales bacterium]